MYNTDSKSVFSSTAVQHLGMYRECKKTEFTKGYYIWIWEQEDWEVDKATDGKMRWERMEEFLVEKGGRKKYITERNGRSSWEHQGIITFCTCQWNEWMNVFISYCAHMCVCVCVCVHSYYPVQPLIAGHKISKAATGQTSKKRRLLNGIYRVSREECARLRESVPYVKLYRYNPNTHVQSWTVTEIMAREKCGLHWCRRTLRRPWRHTCPMRLPDNQTS